MLKDFRCGNCNRLLARMGEHTELQIKCSRCGTLNHVKAASLEQSPMSAIRPIQRPELKSAQ
ncbi:Com family DNA-binding transcriptional regulator [Pseudomonas rubra]|uniref:Com family DNA-binding transcriptional regulator n=1 Tax=Pseudomonas rubra TaxID=2942627 RepID=A0ABT5PEZ3_9PSED|nr:Com family DNA-binding transcriptional regulator [Pseudomonas rubra]MDD1016890.1 Com family DNA-binding transcriptional regulator [Pseudomonas rubra]MDD1039364.1 Com family DNA-binding transcriptional regulator [Pseudomonas rubra]MDD1157854.1 Com family DNA-binding transcriptional regulator [Pseudomonas rubra]